MRTIKFRAKNYKNEWIKGDLIQYENLTQIGKLIHADVIDFVKVKQKTVGQFTGLTDKNGVEIYEGDIIKFLVDNEKYVVEFHEGSFCLVSNLKSIIISLYEYNLTEYEFLGNIHENPELL